MDGKRAGISGALVHLLSLRLTLVGEVANHSLKINPFLRSNLLCTGATNCQAQFGPTGRACSYFCKRGHPCRRLNDPAWVRACFPTTRSC
jgi:hypothetical protein